MKYYLIMSKPDDFGAVIIYVYYGKRSDVEGAYSIEEIPKEHYDILKEYLGDISDFYDKEELKDFIEDYM